jgi:hypothetical protein
MLHGDPTGVIVIAAVVLARILLQAGMKARPSRRRPDGERGQD